MIRSVDFRLHLFLISLLCLRLIAALNFDLGVDEAHYALYAKFLDLSYFDHPPLIGWTHFLFIYLFGNNLFALRISAILLSYFVSFLIYKLAIQNGYKQQTAFFGVIALNSSFMIGALAIGLLPDSLFILISILLIFALQEMEKTKSLNSYIFVGVLLGLAGLAKYTAVLLLVSIILYFIAKKRYDIFFNAKIILSICIAIFIIMPVLIWNTNNNFASLAYQSDHVAGDANWSVKTFFISLGQQFFAYSPPLFIIAFYGFVKEFKTKNLFVLFATTTVVFFGFTQGIKQALPHWISLFFVLFIPIGAMLLIECKNEKIVQITKFFVYLSLVLSVATYLELIFKIGKFPDYNSPFRDIYGWKEASLIAKDLEMHNNAQSVVVENWSMASRVMYYSNSSVNIAQTKKTQFDFWNKPTSRVIFLTDNFSHIPQGYCKNQILLSSYEARLNDGLVNKFSFYLCERSSVIAQQ